LLASNRHTAIGAISDENRAFNWANNKVCVLAVVYHDLNQQVF
jgi:hypothetical protein